MLPLDPFFRDQVSVSVPTTAAAGPLPRLSRCSRHLLSSCGTACSPPSSPVANRPPSLPASAPSPPPSSLVSAPSPSSPAASFHPASAVAASAPPMRPRLRQGGIGNGRTAELVLASTAAFLGTTKAYYLKLQYLVEKATMEKLTTLGNGVSIAHMVDYPVNGFVFQGGASLEDLCDVVSKLCIFLQENNSPFNVLISDSGKRVFLLQSYCSATPRSGSSERRAKCSSI